MISDKEKLILAEVQHMPLCPEPFRDIANRLDMEEEEVLAVCRNLLDKGIIRRFGPSISHRKLGFTANPMTVVKVPEERLDDVGYAIAEEEGVTHCYARSGWDYNLFFMVHGKTREESVKRAEAIIKKIGIHDYKLLFSTRELKKVPFEIPKVTIEREQEGGN